MWTCPHCSTKVDPSFDVCWNCGTTSEGVVHPGFVPADEAGPIEDARVDHPGTISVEPDALQGDLVEAYQALTLMEAKFLADQLNERGIPAVSDTQDLQDSLGAWSSNPRVWVREVNLAKARAWLTEYDDNRKAKKPVLED
jgi:hypothetical protein